MPIPLEQYLMRFLPTSSLIVALLLLAGSGCLPEEPGTLGGPALPSSGAAGPAPAGAPGPTPAAVPVLAGPTSGALQARTVPAGGIANPTGIRLLDEYEAQMIDPTGDHVGDQLSDDLTEAKVVMDSQNLFARVVGVEPMSAYTARDLRFWLERGGNLLTVEVKTSDVDGRCELNHAVGEGGSVQVMNCVLLKPGWIDIIIPVTALPEFLQGPAPIHASNFEVCCIDEGRDTPYDAVEMAQEVFRPGTTVDELAGQAAAAAVPPTAGGLPPSNAPGVPPQAP